MGKILACCAVILFSLAGWQHRQAQAKGPLLCEVPGRQIDTTEEELRVRYPKLFAKNTVISFGAVWCKWCPRQKAHLLTLAAQSYRVAYFDIDEHPELYEFLRGETTDIPLTIVFFAGKSTVSFVGFTNWRKLARAASDCRIKPVKPMYLRMLSPLVDPWSHF